MEVSGQLHAPVVSPSGKEPPVPIGQVALSAGLHATQKRKVCCTTGNRTPILPDRGPVARSIELSRLLLSLLTNESVYIPGVIGSNLGRYTGYLEIFFSWFFSVRRGRY
jgi:hypothetical protein